MSVNKKNLTKILASRYRMVTLIKYFFGFDNLRRKLTGGRRDLEVVGPISGSSTRMLCLNHFVLAGSLLRFLFQFRNVEQLTLFRFF